MTKTVFVVVVKKDGKFTEGKFRASTLTELRSAVAAAGYQLHSVLRRETSNG